METKTHRLQVTLSEQTLTMVEEIVGKGLYRSKSAFLNEAARVHATRLKKARLLRSLRAGYMTRAEQNLALVNEWEPASTELSPEERGKGNPA
jgi:Arc/MetJ-type ribon-helix-helix transcriptional regulator